MSVLALDLSSKTGWAFFNDKGNLIDYGMIIVLLNDFNVNNDPNKSSKYPLNLLEASASLTNLVEERYIKLKPTIVVIENTVKGRNRHTQRLLEFIHQSVLQMLVRKKAKFIYLDPSEWRYILGLRLNKEDKKNNKLVSQGKKRGRITPKHLSVRMANNLFGLNLKIADNNISDAILVGKSYLNTL